MIARGAGRATLLAALAVLAARVMAAQRIEVTGLGMIAGPHATVLEQGTREIVGGTWLGATVEVRKDRWLMAVSGLRGTLHPIENTPFQRDGGEERVAVCYELRHGLRAEATYTARAFSSAAGYQRWNMLGIGAAVSLPLGDSLLHADARGSYLPAVSVSGQASPSVALAAEVGVTAAPLPTPLVIRLNYRFERFDFPSGRLEQFDRVALAVGYRIGLKLR
jgi:hypothetical protein